MASSLADRLKAFQESGVEFRNEGPVDSFKGLNIVAEEENDSDGFADDESNESSESDEEK